MSNKKLNIVDVIIIAIVLLVIGSLVYRFFIVNNSGNFVKKTNIEYTVSAIGIDSVYSDSVSVGDKIYIDGVSENCGTVTKVKKSYVYKTVTDTDGTAERHLYPAAIKLEIFVSATAETTENGFFLNGKSKYLYIGDSARFCTPYFIFDAKVTGFKAT